KMSKAHLATLAAMTLKLASNEAETCFITQNEQNFSLC
ncbi:MAG: hypothetical protein QG559_1412, partial [Campylobacterota bacterium]|nr:hypothetical protein [Campylobacterota bacterium]